MRCLRTPLMAVVTLSLSMAVSSATAEEATEAPPAASDAADSVSAPRAQGGTSQPVGKLVVPSSVPAPPGVDKDEDDEGIPANAKRVAPIIDANKGDDVVVCFAGCNDGKARASAVQVIRTKPGKGDAGKADGKPPADEDASCVAGCGDKRG